MAITKDDVQRSLEWACKRARVEGTIQDVYPHGYSNAVLATAVLELRQRVAELERRLNREAAKQEALCKTIRECREVVARFHAYDAVEESE